MADMNVMRSFEFNSRVMVKLLGEGRGGTTQRYIKAELMKSRCAARWSAPRRRDALTHVAQ